MRWVVSLIVCVLVLPLGLALDISFEEVSQQYFSDPVNITFTTDKVSSCMYSLTHKVGKPDFSCAPTSCAYASCDYSCPQKTSKIPLEFDIPLTPFNNTNEYAVSIDVSPGYYDFFASCTDELETTTKKITFLYNPDTFRVEWSMLSRERFAKTQSSTFYAYIYGHEDITSTQVMLTLPDKSNKTFDLEGFRPGDGYLFSFDLDAVSLSGRHVLDVVFSYGDGEEFIVSKEFIVALPGSFDVAINSSYAYDITFIDPTSNVTSFSYLDITKDRLLVPATRNHVRLKTNDEFSVQLQNIPLHLYHLNVFQDDTYTLETETIGENKPLQALNTQIFYVNDTPEYISMIQFNYSSYNVQDPRTLQIFKAKGSTSSNVDLSSGEFYKLGSRQRPLYLNTQQKLAYIYVNDFSLFALVKERIIGEEILRDPTVFFINLSKKNTSLEGIHHDTWTFPYGNKEYSFLINTIDGAIVYFEFSPNGEIKQANIGSTIRVDIDDDQTDDISLYVKAITPKKILFSAYLLTQPQDQESLEDIIGKDADGKYKLYVSSPWFYVYIILAVLILFFAIIWLFMHGHKKPIVRQGLSDEEKLRLDRSGNERLPILEFVTLLKAKGLDARSIKTRLEVAGWPKDIVEKVLEQEGLQVKTIHHREKTFEEKLKEVHEKEQIKQKEKKHTKPPEKTIDEHEVQQTLDVSHSKKDSTVSQPLKETTMSENTNKLTLSDEEQSLLAYVKKQLALGADKDKVITKLQDVGWHKDIISKVMGLVK